VQEINKLADNPRGINLTFHTGKKTFEGRSFDSTFFFAKATQEYGMAGRGGSGGEQAAAPAPARKFVPKKQLG
jgi:hypothetical protein